jgi:hypothetical protein
VLRSGVHSARLGATTAEICQKQRIKLFNKKQKKKNEKQKFLRTDDFSGCLGG